MDDQVKEYLSKLIMKYNNIIKKYITIVSKYNRKDNK